MNAKHGIWMRSHIGSVGFGLHHWNQSTPRFLYKHRLLASAAWLDHQPDHLLVFVGHNFLLYSRTLRICFLAFLYQRIPSWLYLAFQAGSRSTCRRWNHQPCSEGSRGVDLVEWRYDGTWEWQTNQKMTITVKLIVAWQNKPCYSRRAEGRFLMWIHARKTYGQTSFIKKVYNLILTGLDSTGGIQQKNRHSRAKIIVAPVITADSKTAPASESASKKPVIITRISKIENLKVLKRWTLTHHSFRNWDQRFRSDNGSSACVQGVTVTFIYHVFLTTEVACKTCKGCSCRLTHHRLVGLWVDLWKLRKPQLCS